MFKRSQANQNNNFLAVHGEHGGLKYRLDFVGCPEATDTSWLAKGTSLHRCRSPIFSSPLPSSPAYVALFPVWCNDFLFLYVPTGLNSWRWMAIRPWADQKGQVG